MSDNLINELSSNETLFVSYYYSLNLITLFEVSASIAKKENQEICIANFGKIIWDFYPWEIPFKISCTPSSVLVVFEAEKEIDIPEKFRFATSSKPLKVGKFKANAIKKGNNIYNIFLSNGKQYSVRMINGKLIEIKLERDEEELLKIIDELGGEANIKEVIAIAERRLEESKEKIREKLQFLTQLEKIEIKQGKIVLAKHNTGPKRK
ncbi:hypothetical protein [Acidianus sp. RZ1]|uniref:hypothetical protein n=1 Tax=Acidianus sp. RZ1 TaxID=1540082 RepID=UPI001492ECC5|nr:hypothetical protein [Acidianus sp. RZ1]NON62599.1 hypothetical protein [Acidianus sp. RZ1]